MKLNFAVKEIILKREKIITNTQKSLDRNLCNVEYFQVLLKEQREDLSYFKNTLENNTESITEHITNDKLGGGD